MTLAPEIELLDALDSDIALQCEYGSCSNKPATYRIFVQHNMRDAPKHAPGQIVICASCYELLIKNPTAIGICAPHGYVIRIRQWWTLIGTV